MNNCIKIGELSRNVWNLKNHKNSCLIDEKHSLDVTCNINGNLLYLLKHLKS